MMGSAEIGRELGDAGGPLLVAGVAGAVTLTAGFAGFAAVLLLAALGQGAREPRFRDPPRRVVLAAADGALSGASLEPAPGLEPGTPSLRGKSWSYVRALEPRTRRDSTDPSDRFGPIEAGPTPPGRPQKGRSGVQPSRTSPLRLHPSSAKRAQCLRRLLCAARAEPGRCRRLLLVGRGGPHGLSFASSASPGADLDRDGAPPVGSHGRMPCTRGPLPKFGSNGSAPAEPSSKVRFGWNRANRTTFGRLALPADRRGRRSMSGSTSRSESSETGSAAFPPPLRHRGFGATSGLRKPITRPPSKGTRSSRSKSRSS